MKTSINMEKARLCEITHFKFVKEIVRRRVQICAICSKQYNATQHPYSKDVRSLLHSRNDYVKAHQLNNRQIHCYHLTRVHHSPTLHWYRWWRHVHKVPVVNLLPAITLHSNLERQSIIALPRSHSYRVVAFSHFLQHLPLTIDCPKHICPCTIGIALVRFPGRRSIDLALNAKNVEDGLWTADCAKVWGCKNEVQPAAGGVWREANELHLHGNLEGVGSLASEHEEVGWCVGRIWIS
jgi:hypothetical protein